MNKRLKYERFMNTDNIITIDLHNAYSTIAIIGKDENNNYDVCLMLKENTVDKWDLIEEAEHITFNSNTKNIYSAILKTVGTYLQEGFFDYYINRYEYELKCFELGNEIEENKRLGEKFYKVKQSKIAYRTVYYCSECGGDLGDTDTEQYSFCPNCRVALDWSSIE